MLLPGAALNSAQVEVRFNVLVPETSDEINIEIIDEITGIPYHSLRYKMVESGPNAYSISLPFLQNALIKYRYLRRGSSDNIECNNLGQAVNYRLYFAPTPGEVRDTIYSWTDHPVIVNGGTIAGKVMLPDKTSPAGSILVSAAGMLTETDAMGNFNLNNVPAGIQTLVAFSPDGALMPFQQGAKVLANAITYASVIPQPANWVNLTFKTSIPPDSPQDMPPVHLLGNLLNLGDTFSTLQGGVSIDPSRTPVMLKQSDGNYALTLKLPAGFDLQYKYSLGDGFWNAEHTLKGDILTREIIVPEQDTVINDQVAAWGIPGLAPVRFNLSVPENTPSSSPISVQLSPFSSMEPVPMWSSSGKSPWNLTLFPPMADLSTINYTYCHDNICGTSNNISASSPSATPKGSFVFSASPQNLVDDLKNWAWWQNPLVPATLSGDTATPKGSQFIAAVEFSPDYSHDLVPGFMRSIQHIRQLGANWIFLTPQWQWSSDGQAFAAASINSSIYESDLSEITHSAAQNGLSVAYFPGIIYPHAPKDWWEKAPHDATWWDGWFKTYDGFILNQAVQAEKNQAGMLIIGGPGVTPALPGGMLKNGQGSGVFQDSVARWQNIIKHIRSNYHGAVVWAVSDEDLTSVPESIKADVDAIYLLYSSGVLDNQQAITPTGLIQAINQPQKINKPVIIGLEYPSVRDSVLGCKWDYSNSCWGTTNQNEVDLVQQMSIYETLFKSVNENKTISGLVSRGFSAMGPAMDPSSSIYGKPASALLWYWYPKWTSSP